MTTLKRVSLSLPISVADDLDYISSRLGVSRSAFVSQMLVSADLGQMRSLLSSIPVQPSEADTKRFRGESREFVKDQLTRLAKLQGGLFDDSGK
jgi:hypothetical protein